MVFARLVHGPKSVGHEFVGLSGGKPINGAVDVGTAHTRHHHLLDVGEFDVVVVEILTKGSVERGHGVGSGDTDRRNHYAISQPHNFGGADANVNSYNYTHKNVLFLVFLTAN